MPIDTTGTYNDSTVQYAISAQHENGTNISVVVGPYDTEAEADTVAQDVTDLLASASWINTEVPVTGNKIRTYQYGITETPEE